MESVDGKNCPALWNRPEFSQRHNAAHSDRDGKFLKSALTADASHRPEFQTG